MLKISITVLGLFLIFAQRTHAGEKSLYDFLWLDPDKKVYVLQNKLYKKEHTFYADVGYLSNFTSKFQDTNGFQLKAGYYVHEEWGLELFHNSYSNKNNSEYNTVQSNSHLQPFVRRLQSTTGALVIWSPFYGKINTFNQIYYFDWSFGAGLAAVKATSNRKNAGVVSAPNSYDSESYSGAVLKTNVKFHVRKNIHVGVEYMNTYYRAPGPAGASSTSLRTNSDLIVSLGFSF